MKRYILMLLVACSTISINAQTKGKANANTPSHVISKFDAIINLYGQKDKQSYSVTKNPNTGIIESKEVITHFTCDKNDAAFCFIDKHFHADEAVSYQLHHIAKGNPELFSLKVVTNDAMKNNYLRIRQYTYQEMWFMCCKNPVNPQLRDAYAIVWKDIADGKVEGDIYMITSLRPDIYEKNLETSRKTFRIEGRVDAEIKDSLYNVYIADSYDELNDLADDDYVACVPVINKRFEYTVELDKPKAGRIRCIFPDGSLCSAWINLDMVPGETYRITVHNGYFDEDRDFENRVGRWSGKSLIAGHDNDDAVAVVGDTVLGVGYGSEPVIIDDATSVRHDSNEGLLFLSQLTDSQKAKLEQVSGAISQRIQMIENLYKTDVSQEAIKAVNGKYWPVLDVVFDQASEHYKLLNGQLDTLIGYLDEFNIPNSLRIEIYKGGLKFYTEQNNNFNMLYSMKGHLSKSATKCQKLINKGMEKCVKKMNNAMK